MDELVYLTHSTDLVLVTEEFDAVLAQLGIEHVEKETGRSLWQVGTTPEASLILMRVGQAGHSILKIKLGVCQTSKLAREDADAMSIWTGGSYTVPDPLVLRGPKEALNKLIRRLVAAEQATASGDKSTDPMVDGRGRQITNYSRSLGLTQVEGVQHGHAGAVVVAGGTILSGGARSYFGANITLGSAMDAAGLTVNPPQVYAPTTPAPQA